jgi:cephalosporin hydroxylase
MSVVKALYRFLPLSIRAELWKLRNLLYEKALYSKDIVDQFHALYYNSHIWGAGYRNTSWLSVPVLKCPLDLWIYQEIISEVKPDVIVECETAYGGSALFLASICDLVGRGRFLTIDIERKSQLPHHGRIQYFTGSSVSPDLVEQIRASIGQSERTMVILDSDHKKSHVLQELRIYSGLVTLGRYLVVEDTDVNGHPVLPLHGPGPMEAVEEFMGENHNFVVDKSREKFFLTFNPKGYLRKVR